MDYVWIMMDDAWIMHRKCMDCGWIMTDDAWIMDG
jgi:hypothetical protein